MSTSHHRKTYWKRILFAVLLYNLALSACSTIAQRDLYISVDSEERGVPVYDEEGQSIGETPFFHRASTGPQVLLYLAKPPEREVRTLRCQYRWGSSPLENFPLALAGAGIASLPGAIVGLSGGLGIDLLSGAAFHCPERFELSPLEGTVLNYCPRHLMMIPEKLSPGSRGAIRSRWLNRIREEERCATLVPEELGEIWLKRLELELEDFQAAGVKQEQLAHLGYETGATHAVTFRLRQKPGRAGRLEVKSYDLHVRQLSGHTSLPLSLRVARELSQENAKTFAFVRGLVSSLPETFALGVNERRFHQRGEGILAPRTRRGPSIKLTSVSHPDAFNSWASDYHLSPLFGFDISEELPLADEGGLGDGKLRRFSRLSLGLLASVTYHTPLGALSAGLGPGYGFYDLQEEGTSTQSHRGFELISGLQYTAFITPTLLLRFYADIYQPSLPPGQRDIYLVSDVGVVIGYYFQQLKPWVHSLF
ncbi:MAG: hypothetical protein VYD19_04130 [Myxococcota bacterium]|nr:hypothetical protein [Myxococcota bacterium]